MLNCKMQNKIIKLFLRNNNKDQIEKINDDDRFPFFFLK